MTGTPDTETLAIFERRLARKLKLLPKLRYPNDEDSKKLADLAELDPARANEFASHIRSILLDAHLNFSRRGFSKRGVRAKLRGIANKAKYLSRDLRSIDVGSGGSGEAAGLLLDLEFGKIKMLPELIDLFQTLGEAAERAAAKSQRAREKLALDILVQNLYMAARQHGGYWTISRATNQITYRGPLLEALEILKEYLPKGMLPATKHGRLNGRAIEYALEKLKKHIKGASQKT